MDLKHWTSEMDIVIAVDSIFVSVTNDLVDDSWVIIFSNDVSVSITALWRLLKDERIKLISADHGHTFGLPKPVDVNTELTTCLTGKKLTSIIIMQNTADMVLVFTDGFKIVIFISSGGYESYNLRVGRKQYIGMGMGDIEILAL